MSQSGLVVQAWANRGIARLADERLIPFHFPRRLIRPLPGDQIRLNNELALVEVAPRRNEFGRGDNRGRFRAAAANLDRAIIVIAPQPAPSPDLIHRYLAAALIHGIEPVIVLNKTDQPLPEQAPFTELDDLAALGYRIIRTRCKPQPEVAELLALCRSGASLLAGQSGVGKTSLLNALVPDLDERTSALSHVTGKGTHTTTTATVYPLANQGDIIDTPGVWEYGLWAMPASELERGFPEFAEHSAHCRFRDCRHASEPGCAVRAAAESGLIPPSRHAAWLRLLAEQRRFS